MQAQQGGEDRSRHVCVIPASNMCTPSTHLAIFKLLSWRHSALFFWHHLLPAGTARLVHHMPVYLLWHLGPLQGSPSLMGKGGGVVSGAVALKARRMAHARQEPALCRLALAPLQERRHLGTCRAPSPVSNVPATERRNDMLRHLILPGSATASPSVLSGFCTAGSDPSVDSVETCMLNPIHAEHAIVAHLQRKVPLHERLIQWSQGGAGQPREALRQLPHQVLGVPQPACTKHLSNRAAREGRLCKCPEERAPPSTL